MAWSAKLTNGTGIKRWVLIGAGVLCLVALVYTLFALSARVYAGSAGGPGGTGFGGNGTGYDAQYGYSWYIYDVNGGGPSGGFRDGTTTWAFVQGACRGGWCG